MASEHLMLLEEVRDFIAERLGDGIFTHIAAFGAEGIARNGSRGMALMFVVREGACSRDEALSSLSNALGECWMRVLLEDDREAHRGN